VRRAPALAIAAAAIALGACGGGGNTRSSAALSWQGRPQLLTPPTLPRDRVLTGLVRNRSGHVIALSAKAVRLVTAAGATVPSSAIFLQDFKHPLEPYNRPDPVPIKGQELAGRIARLKPGKTLPMTVSWHRPAGAQPQRVLLGGASLAFPRT